jgi:hypothetical protein
MNWTGRLYHVSITIGWLMGHIKGTASTDDIRIGSDKRIFGRQVPDVKVPDVDEQPNQYIVDGLMALHKETRNLARIADDRSRPVDEYRTQTLTPDAELVVTVQPQYDQISERIESVIVTGPAGAVTIQLGDRTWLVTIPATGVLVIAPVSLLLSRNDYRQLTSATPGDYSLELMGWADERY